MNYYLRYPAKHQSRTLHLTMEQDGALNRLSDWYWANERPIPHDKRYAIARAMTAAERRSTDEVLREFFVLAAGTWVDEELDVLIEDAQAKAQAAEESRSEKNGNEKERQRRTRARRTKLFADLRERGVVPDAMASMAELKQLHVEHVTHSEAVTSRLLSRVTGDDVTRDVTGVNTATHTNASAGSPPDSNTTPVTEFGCDDRDGVGRAMPGPASVALNRVGVRVTSHNPNLIAACEEGVAIRHLLQLAQLYPDKPANYVIRTARREHAERAVGVTTTTTGGSHASRRPSLTDSAEAQNAEHDRHDEGEF